MHTEADTQTVTNTLALCGVTRRRTPWRYIAYTLAGVAVFNVAYATGTVLKAALGW